MQPGHGEIRKGFYEKFLPAFNKEREATEAAQKAEHERKEKEEADRKKKEAADKLAKRCDGAPYDKCVQQCGKYQLLLQISRRRIIHEFF